MDYLESVSVSGLLDEVKKSERERAFEQLKVYGRKYEKEQAVFFEGDVIDRICMIGSGSVRGEKTYSDGEVHIVDVFERGAIFGLEYAVSKSMISAMDFICNDDAEVIFVPVSSIEKSRYANEICRALMFMLADNNIKQAHKIEILAERGLRDRIMVYLNVLRRKSGSNAVTVNMDREQLARFLCVNRSALSNELSKMKREGVIDFKGSKFTVL